MAENYLGTEKEFNTQIREAYRNQMTDDQNIECTLARNSQESRNASQAQNIKNF